MAEFVRATLSSIHVGERLRPIDMDYAEAIAASMSQHGQISPIMIRKTPAKKGTPYTLVAGGYRTTAATLLGWTEIDAIVVKADAVEAQLLEISENLYRNELNPLDRAIFVMKYRELWEEKHGKITRGGDQKSKPQNAGLIFSAGRELSKLVQERLGISQDKYERAVSIGTKLDPVLKQAVRGTTAENDQSQLLTLAKLPREDQIAVAAALKHTPDVKKVLAFTKPTVLVATPPAASQSIILTKLIAAWDEASEETRDSFLERIGVSDAPDALMAAIREEAA
ncbi:ParB/RepB/Spo0J family partition protein [Agrobacterium tumefaciens]|uniref:ParB/RepB/Spo0J family partition protein n=1 Tax=Agrobacterium tumefaciens TaxID=358 RepID=A0AAE6EH17_AGRTU|nr:ParB/RepB/Spo0J family partition protein [Agrobacterium tumefaciens]QCL81156.1 ParB/RepB/Spo0J family partition protein [Agrobacterium tumefaciens]